MSHPLRRRSRSSRGSRASATTAAAPFTASRMRRIVPRLRRSGSTGRTAFCLIIGRIPAWACKHRARHGRSGGRRGRASARRQRPRRCRRLSATRRTAAQANADPRPRRPRPRPPMSDARTSDATPAPDAGDAPPPAALVRPLRRADVGARQALHTRRSTSTAASPTPTSPARSRTRACSPPSACSPRDDLAAIERGMATIARRDRSAASSPGRATSRTSTSTSRSG